MDLFTGALTLHGTVSAANLEPHLAYQFKLVGNAYIIPRRAVLSNQRARIGGRIQPR